MAKRVKRRSPGKATPKEMRHNRRNTRQRRVLLASAAGVILVIVFVLGFGYYRENIAAARAPVAVVNGEAISTDAYQRLVQYQRLSIIQTLGGQLDQQTLVSLLQGQLPPVVLDNMIDQVLIEQKAAELGITVSDAEVQQQIEQNFGYTGEDPTPTPAGSDTVTGTVGAGAITRAQFDEAYKSYLDILKTEAGISEAQYRQIVRDEILRNKVRAQIVADVPTTAAQVHARDIVVETEEEAQTVRQRLMNGEDFAAVAQEVSTDTSTADKGGDMGWFLVNDRPALTEVALKLPIGDISDPIQTSSGYQIIEVLERDLNRALTPAQLQQAQDDRFNQWRQEQRGAADIQRFFTPEDVPPLPAGLSSSQPAPQPQPTVQPSTPDSTVQPSTPAP